MNIYRFEKCIICLKEPNANEDNTQLTVEHIVPEFIGGKLTLKNVCKACNSRLGEKIEGPLSKNFLFKAYAYFNGIKGKKDKLINPLSGTYKHSEGTLRFNDDFSIHLIPDYQIHEKDDGGFIFSVRADIKDISKIEKEASKSISRLAKKKGKTINKKKLDEQLEKICIPSIENTKLIEQPEITVSFSIDYDMIALLAIKIAYEFIAYYFGSSLFKFELDKFRSSLLNCSLNENIIYSNDDFSIVLKSILAENPFLELKEPSKLEEIFSKNKTLIMLVNGGCSVRVANFWFNFQLPVEFENVFLIFSSDSKTGEHRIFKMDDFINEIYYN